MPTVFLIDLKYPIDSLSARIVAEVRRNEGLGRAFWKRDHASMPAHKCGYVERDCDPEDANEARFTRLVAQQLLCEQCAGPAASQSEEMLV